MVGESPSLRGGISSVQNLIIKNISPEICITHLATVVAYPSDPSLPKAFAFVRALVKLLVYLVKGEVDVVHVHLSERGSAFRKMVVSAIVLIFRIPIILHAHGSEFHLFYPKLPLGIRWIMRSIFRRCDQLIVLSNSWKKFYAENLGFASDQLIVLENPVEIPPHTQDRSKRDIVNLLFLGRIGERKGAFDLLKAFSALPPNLLEFSKLYLAGDGDVDAAKCLSQKLNLGDRVEVLGWIDSNQRNELLNKCDIFVLPSYNEGLPVALLEAMAHRLPVITSPVGGIPELITHQSNGLLVTPGDIEQLTQFLTLLIEKKDLRNTLGATALESVKPFNVNDYCTSLSSLYCSLTSSNIPRETV